MYNPNVKIGNWFEDIELEKEKTAEFLEKRKQGKLLVQQTRRLFNNLLRETKLSKCNDGFLKFGNCVQLMAPDMPASPPTRKPSPNFNEQSCNKGVVVAGSIHYKHIDKISNLVSDCHLIASPILVPSIRNTFVIKSADDCDRDRQNLLFGQKFVLQLVDSAEPLYIRSEKPLVDGPHGPLDHDPVSLSNKKDSYCWWEILHWDPKMRFETEGAPFPPLTRVVLRHSMSGLDLAVEGTVWWLTIFGNECGLSVHTYVNHLNKRETAECLWIFVTNDCEETSCDK